MRAPGFSPPGDSKISVSTAMAKKQWHGQGETLVYEKSSSSFYLAGAVKKVLDAKGKELGAPVEVQAFVRWSVGEESGSGEAA